MKKAKQTRNFRRARLHARLRTTLIGKPERPRLNVAFTGSHIYAQIIDDTTHSTLVGVSTTEKALAGKPFRPNVAGAGEVGRLLAERAKAKKISAVVFDRGGFRYHGKVKALADAAREGGLQF
jgi:large subunit ribosomal protein L18